MTREEAVTAYCEAVNAHEPEKPETKAAIRKAREAMMPFLKNGRIPEDLVKIGRKVLK